MNLITKEKAEVSVCVPVYNGIKFLSKALDSILNQSFHNIEVIAVDDNSTDGSFQVLETYALQDTRIKIYRNNVRKGLVGNWNECIRHASGNWIKFVFQDDIILPSCIEKQMKCAEAMIPGYRMVFARRSFFFEGDVPDAMQWYRFKKSYWDLFPVSRVISPNMVIRTLIKYPSSNLFGEPTSFLIEKNIFSKYGLFDDSLRQICDLEYWLRVGMQCGFGFVNEELIRFRVHGSSTSASNLSLKEFESKYLDKLLLHRKLLYDDIFSYVRARFSRWPCTIFFRVQFEISARRAKLALNELADNHACAIWKATCEKYPEIHIASMKLFFPLAIRYVLSRTCALFKIRRII